MAFAVLVVDCYAPLEERTQPRRVERFADLRVVKRLRLVEQEPPIAIGAGNERVFRFGSERQRAFERFCTVEQLAQSIVIEPLQDQDLRAAEQCRIERKAGIFRGRADQRHRAAFDERQEAVLLRTVEAVDLVHEQQRTLSRFGRLVGGSEGLLEIGDSAEHRADAFEAHADTVREQSCDSRFARAGRPPQDHARQAARSDHPADCAFGAGQVFLPDDVLQRRRPQPVGEWSVFARRIRGLRLR